MRRVFLTSLLIACFCGALSAAAPTGTIAGSIQDPGGAVVPNARVTATASATGLTRETHSGNDGQYVIPLLPVGTFSVSVEAGGFDRFEQTGVVVTADQNSMVTVKLQVGSSTQSVTVSGDAQMVETRSGALSQVINQRNIVELPLNGRNPAALVLLTPGTLNLGASNAGGGAGGLQTVAYPGALLISSGGARYNGVNYYLDGGFNEDIYNSINNPFPNPDAVEEFSVVTNSYSAEYGGASGAIVNVVTKSGTNQFHGDGFDFLRNEVFNARNFFAASPDPLKRNQFGGSLGGPIKRDKLFFFANYQGTWSRDVTQANPATVPTAAERQGNFSAINAKLVNPYTGAAYVNNQIPSSQFAPASVRVLQSILLPQTPNGLVYYSLPVDSQENQFLTRVDYNLSKHRIFGRYFYTHYILDPVSSSQNLLQLAQGNDFFDQQATFSDTYTVSPNMINTLVFAYTRDNDVITAAKPPFTWPGLGIPIAGSTQGQPEVSLSISGWFAVQTGHYTDNNRHTFDLSDILHWMKGSHEIMLGGEYVRMNDVERNIVNQNGTFSFSGTSLTGNPVSDFMIGDVFQFVQGGGEYFDRSGNLPSLFFEDKYRVNRSLVLDVGLRWDPFFAYSDSLHRTECFVPGQHSNLFPNSPAGYLFEGDPGCPAGGFNPSWKEFAPRFGFAYNPRGTSKTTVRGGFGMFYQPPYMNMYTRMSDSAPFSPQYVLNSVPFMNPYQGIPNPFPAQFDPFVPPSNSAFALPLGAAQSFQPNWRPAEVMGWNVTVEHQLANNLLIRTGYVASAGRLLSHVTDVNAPLPSPTATKANETARRPYQQYGAFAYNMSGANSIYNALQISLEKRFSKGFSLTANYTWSKSIDTVTNTGGFAQVTAIVDPYNLNAYRGVSDFNVPQNFVLNAFWQIPSPQHGLAKALFGGWATTGVWTWQSGFPLNIKSGGDYSFSLPENANDQAQLISPWQYTTGSRGQRIHQWFTTSSFTHPAANTFGNVGRNTLVGPGTFNIDFAIHRTFSLTERFTLQYRAEFFNALNTPEFNNPNTTLTANTFGQITAARDPRIIQMALKLVF